MNSNILISLKNFDLSVIEHSQISTGWLALNTILKNETKNNFLEVIPTLDGKIVSLVGGQENILNLHSEILGKSAYASQAFIKNMSLDALKAFYHLGKPNFKKSVAVLELPNITSLIELIHFSSISKIEILDHRNSRGFNCNTLFLSANVNTLKEFTTTYSSKILRYEILEEVSPSLLSFFSFTEPS